MTQTIPGKFPHIVWMDLQGDGVLTEVAVVKTDAQGNIYFLNLRNLDDIDKRRLTRIVADRNANRYELWDLLSQKTLGNGINALEYFHQLVKVMTPQGRVISPRVGQMGIAAPVRRMPTQPVADEAPAQAVTESVAAQAEAPAQKKTTRRRTTTKKASAKK